MNCDSIDIIKLGGSVITDKTEYKKRRFTELKNICNQIGRWGGKCIIVHGAGSYGHIMAKEHNITSGYSDKSQIQGLMLIRKDMHELSAIVVNELISVKIDAIYFQTSSLTYLTEEKDQYAHFFDPIQKALQLDLVPVLSGDIIFAKNRGFDIISGDALIEILSRNFNVKRVIFVTDVDGLMIGEVGTTNQKHLEHASRKDLETLDVNTNFSKDSIDVTGSMKGKIESILSLLDSADEVIIVNGLEGSRVLDVLQDKETPCTRIK
ncbi:MAG: hypothetical protein KGD64_13985 [Candidatus Heimdallarchaeota archaeon]|nr:hypothetical protein [Candidatus Heimdallarchaeota archaeon]